MFRTYRCVLNVSFMFSLGLCFICFAYYQCPHRKECYILYGGGTTCFVFGACHIYFQLYDTLWFTDTTDAVTSVL